MIRVALWLLMGRRRRILALVGLAFAALGWLYRRRRRKTTVISPVARPVGGTRTVGVVVGDTGYEPTTMHLRPADVTTARRDEPEPS